LAPSVSISGIHFLGYNALSEDSKDFLHVVKTFWSAGQFGGQKNLGPLEKTLEKPLEIADNVFCPHK
jgi:hypothetical protein